MSELNASNGHKNIQVAYLIEENGKNKILKPCTLTFNVVNKNDVKLCDRQKSTTLNQQINLLNVQTVDTNPKNNVEYRILRPEDLDLKLPIQDAIPKPIKRPKQKKPDIEESESVETNGIPKKIFRTRSGRMSKPPKHIQQDKSLETSIKSSISSTDCSEEMISVQTVEKTIHSNENSESPKKIEHKRNISSQYRCGTCNKAYLGQNKMMKHLHLNPGHIAPEFRKKSSELNIWSELLRRTKELPKNQQSQIFCKELINLIYKAKYVIPKLIKPALKVEENNFNVDSLISNALGIPEGNYTFSENISVQEAANTEDNKNNFVRELEECSESVQNNDQNSLLNLLDTGQVTFDTSSNSEEVMNVDQLVNERLKSLTGGELEAPNGTQNLSLDLSLDMFAYQDS